MHPIPGKRNCTMAYALLHSATWSFYAIMLAFSSNVLYEYGFSDSAISLFLGVSTALSVVTQVVSAEILSRSRRIGVHTVLSVFGAVLLMSCILLLVPNLGSAAAVVLFGICCMLLQTLPSLANSMGMDSIKRGAPTDYSLARGCGSLAYSLVALLTGAAVRRSGTVMIAVLGAVSAVALIGSAIWYHRAVCGADSSEETGTEQTKGAFLVRYPRFAWFLLGTVFLCVSHNLLCNFMYQIMLSRNGGTMEQGIATSISALVELPVMFGFPLLLKKVRCDKWVRFAAAAIALKPLGILLSDGPAGIYLAQSTQMLGYGLLVISSVNYAERVVEKGESIRAQSYHGAATTVSTVAALSMGGVIIEYLGIQAMLLLSLGCSVVGALLIAFFAQKTE